MAKKPESEKDPKDTSKKSSSTSRKTAASSARKKSTSRKRTSSSSASAGTGRRSTKKTGTGSAKSRASGTGSGASRADSSPEEMPRTASEAVDQAIGRPISDKIWRLIAMIAFTLIAYFGFIALVVLAAMQYIVVLVADKPNGELRKFMGRLTAYLRDIYEYLSYARDEMPFPFSTFPEDEG